jgi:prepilin-type N-terminal cleavage/methylation domain-containing protein
MEDNRWSAQEISVQLYCGEATLKRAGFSLIEMLVVMFLMGTIGALIMGLFFPSIWMWKSQQAYSDVQQACMIATTRLEQRLLNCQMESLVVLSNGHTLCFQQVVTNGGGFDVAQGNPVLESRINIVYLDSQNRQIREKVWSGQPVLTGVDFTALPNHLVRLNPTQISQLIGNSALRSEALAHFIESFEISDSDGDTTLLTLPLVVKVRCKLTEAQSTKREEHEMVFKISPRSQSL